uniref:Uncharacterized protein n=1 Tax=Nicotiana tabacum TaxID=4097 RepID=A0A1S3Y7D5_TOBAC
RYCNNKIKKLLVHHHPTNINVVRFIPVFYRSNIYSALRIEFTACYSNEIFSPEQTCAGSVILTDIVFWFIILPYSSNSHLQLNLLMGGMHSLNIIFLLIDTCLNSLPLPWSGLAYFVLWSCCYVIFQWLIHACGLIWWPYPFLELSTPWAPLWYFCLAVFHLPCYGIYWLLVAFKNSTFSTLFPQAFVRHSC